MEKRGGKVINLPGAKKPCEFVAGARQAIKKLPQPVRSVFAYAIYLAEIGEKHPDARPLKGFGGAGVLEVVEDYDKDTYRAFYTLKFAGVVYVLDAIQKKSTKGKATPKVDMDRISARLALAQQHYQINYRVQETGS
jgi:phage-related protein